MVLQRVSYLANDNLAFKKFNGSVLLKKCLSNQLPVRAVAVSSSERNSKKPGSESRAV